jgi:DNA-binding PadR family transcriptional regulator
MDELLLQNMKTELRRGTQVLAVLNQLNKTQYGYSLLQELENKKVAIEAGTLYPLLRRLESQGLLNSEWDTTENRPRKYYLLSDAGEEILKELQREWDLIVKETASLMEENTK